MSFEISVASEVSLAPARRGLRCRWRGEEPDFAYWSTTSALRHHVRGGGPLPDLAELRVALRPGAKGDTLREAERLEQALTRSHLAPVPTIGPAELLAEAVEDAAVRAELRSQALFDRGGKLRSRHRARRAATQAIADEAGARRLRVATDHDADREEADLRWAALRSSHPAAVLGAIEATFDVDDVPAVPVGLVADELAVVVCGPGVTAIPEHGVGWRRGRPMLVERSEAERAEVALRVLASQILAVVRRATAGVPGLRRVRVLAVSGRPGSRTVDATYAGAFEVSGVDRWAHPETDPVAELDGVPGRLLASAEGLLPLELGDQPEADRVVKEVTGALYP